MFSAVSMIKETLDESNLDKFIREELGNQYVVSKKISEKNDTITLVVVGERISNNHLKELQQSLIDYGFEDKKLVVQQDESKISDIDKYINEIKNKSSDFIIDNQSKNKNELEKQIKESEMGTNEIAKELKAIYPQINEVYAGYLIGEKDKSKEIPTLVIYSSDENLSNKIDNIEKWFEARTGQQNVKVYVEQRNPEDVKTDNEINR